MADLSGYRILVTNDDGIHAEGLVALEKIARSLSDDVWVVAPESEQSGAGHSLTMHEPIRMRQIEERRYEILGTPTDCVLMAVLQIIEDKRPDLILSGINRGMNVAEDVTYSGTIAAAMEGTLLDIPSIALSMEVVDPLAIDWELPGQYAPDMIKKLVAMGWPKGDLININFPAKDVKGIKVCPQGRRKIGEKLIRREDPKGRPYFWIGGPATEPYEDHPGADYMQMISGHITVTPLCLDLTDYKTLETIREHFES
ncbi:MAG: 5'/3'-nucleotidase SurE [Rickettsiales bacterium]|nr:5'/3'-nucleotidase SurE [Rickettsiales bacterium]